jgi:ferredoxin-NADP reductase
MKHFDTHLLSSQEIADGTMAFDFVKPDGFRFKAGNAVNLTLVDPPYTDGKGNTRTFSIVSAPSEPGLVFATRMRGSAFKRTLKSASMGMRAWLAEPGGAFTLDAADRRPAVFLTGGIGVTPFVSMSRQAAAEQLPRSIWLFHSNRRPEDAPFLEGLAALERANPNYRYIGTMTHMETSARTWSGERSFIDHAMLKRHLGDLPGALYYIAGPPSMVEAMQRMLDVGGVPADAVRTDEFYGY